MKNIVKYHNDFNKQLILKHFTSYEMNYFMSLCSIAKEKGVDLIEIDFKTLKFLSNYTRKDNLNFINSLKTMNEKLLKLNFTLKNNENGYTQFVLFPTFDILPSSKIVRISVNQRFTYLLNNLSNNFTRFELDNFTNLQSKYSKLLYKELMMFKSTGYLILTIEDFRLKLDIPKSYRMSDIDKFVFKYINKELKSVFKKFKITKIKKGKNVSLLEFNFILKNIKNEIINIDIDTPKTENNKIIFKENENLEIIKNYWASTFIGVNFTIKHQTIIDKILKSNSVAYVKDYLHRIWEFVLTDKSVLDKQAYFSKMILDEKDIASSLKPNISDTIDIKKDKEQADNFMNKLGNHISTFIQENLYDMEKRLDDLEAKKENDNDLNLKEITQAEFDALYQQYLKDNKRDDSIVQKVVFKGMTSNKYKIVEKKLYTAEDIPAELLLSKSGKKLVGAALQMKISKILEEMNK